MLSWVSQSLFFDYLRACCGTVSQIWEGIHVQLVRRSVAELSLRVERVSMSNVTRLFAFAVLMIALHRGFFGSSSMSSTRSLLDEDIPVWAQILFLLTVSVIHKTRRQGTWSPNIFCSSWYEPNRVHQLQAHCSGDKGVWLYLISSSLPIIAPWSPKGFSSCWDPLESDTMCIMDVFSLLGLCWVGFTVLIIGFLSDSTILMLDSLGSILVPGLRRRLWFGRAGAR